MKAKDNMEVQSSADNFVQDSAEYDIVFSPDHDLSKLWVIWTGQEVLGQSLRLSLLPEGSDQQSFQVKDPECEIRRIQTLLTHMARVRVKQVLAHVTADELAVVFPSEDEMIAWMFLFPPIGKGQQLTSSQLNQALQRRGVTYGVNWNMLCGMSESSQRNFHLFPIAVGKAPVPGRDGQILDRYPRVLEKVTDVDDLSQADYKTLNLVQEIRKGDVICEIISPRMGMAGRTVTGKTIPGPLGKAAEVPQGRNTCLSEDGKCLIAEREGHLCFSGRSFHVKPVLNVYEDSDSEEQNIKYLGDVHIHGDLRSGVNICAIGNVQIDGAMEACTVEAGENIIVSGGVQGQDQAVLHAQKSVYAKYLEHCTVYAQESVQADCIINCHVYSNGTIRVRTGRGAIVGGTVRAAREVSATTVGSKAERDTIVVLGGQPCEEAERMQMLEEIQGIEHEMTKLERRKGDPAQEQKKAKLHLKQCVAKIKLEKIDKDIKDIEEQAKAGTVSDQRQLLCDTAYPGTTVAMNHNSYRVDQEEHECVIRFANGVIGKQ